MQASPFSSWPLIGPLADRLWPLVQWFLRWRYARFAVVGASGTVVNMLVLYVLQEWLLRGIEPAPQRLYLSLAGAIALATVNNFCWNSWWTWSDRLAADQPVLALNGATAMRAMAESREANLIGATQVTEINYTEGVDLVDVLPPEFELITDYTLGICSQSHHPEQAQLLADLLTGPASEAVRRLGGFEF
jgi:hypothetical protein